MKVLKNILLVLLSLAVIASPFVFTVTAAVNMTPCYQNTFVGALDKKVERLYSTEGEKIVIIGGSSAAFGLDSSLIEKYTGMPVVNFGLYASLGTKLMLDLSRSAIGEGDIVIIAPELDAQTLSLYFNSETALQAMDGNFSMLKYVDFDNIPELLAGMWKLSADKRELLKKGIPNPDGVYNSASFNSYGDIDYSRPENIMHLYYDPNVTISPEPEILSPDFVEYLNDYTRLCKMRGAEVYYSFAPMNKAGFEGGFDEVRLSAFADYLESQIDATVISNISSYVYEAGYFYDTNFHLNESGAVVHTVNLIKDILFELGIPRFVDVSVPPPPELPFADMRWYGEEEGTSLFTYELLTNGGYRISGLTEEGMAEKALTLPLGYNGYKIVSVGADAFAGSAAEKLIIPENTNIRTLEDSCFRGANKLSELWIYYPEETDINPPSDFYGVARDFTVHVPEDSYYDMGYDWSQRNLTFIKDIK